MSGLPWGEIGEAIKTLLAFAFAFGAGFMIGIAAASSKDARDAAEEARASARVCEGALLQALRAMNREEVER